MSQLNAYLPVQDLDNDLVLQAGPQIFDPPKTITELLALPNSIFSLQQNADGEQKLCVIKGDDAPYYMILIGQNEQNYTIKAMNFEVVDYVGGHPIHRPGSKP